MSNGQTATGQPIYILKDGTERTRGRTAQSNNIYAARLIAETVKSTLGPRGMDKMLVDSMGDVVITNDGATILKEIDVAHPAAKMVIEVAKTQDAECGDGTTTSVILTGELLKVAGDLLEKGIHPTTITGGYNIAAKEALRILNGMAMPIKKGDTKTLGMIANTSLASKNASANAETMTKIVVDACTAVAETLGSGKTAEVEVDLDNILVQKAKGGSLEDTSLIQGIILDKERVHSGMPQQVTKAKIALVNVALEIKKTEVDAKIEITAPNQLEAFLAQEEKTIKDMVEKVKKSGATVLVCQKGIDDLAQHFLSKAGIYAVRRAKKSDMEKLAKATGAEIVNTLDDLNSKTLGSAGLVEERKIGEDKFTFVTECPSAKAVSILLRGGTEHVVDEAERALHDALSVVAVALEDGKMTPGGGAAATEIAMGLREFATTIGGREQLAIEAYADAFEVVPRTLAENAGLDELDILLNLRRAHKKGQKNAGVNVFTGKIEDMVENHVIEPLRVGTQEIKAATEAAVMILRIDDVIAAKSFSPPGGGAGGMPGGMGGGDMDF
ncbi:MAG TPA: thermosome subunit beta [Candidatus Thermoplasmatota archaeon]|nr:thermosome subunit beta [Candidatus Thermoplasmatota archaeon]